MSASTVHVKNISSETSEKEVKDFFSFCGKIANIEITPGDNTKSATVTFEKETAAKTALLLDNTQLGATHVQVSSASGSSDEETHTTTNADRDSDEITQEEKPRSRIIAEYLAHGYVIGDQAAQKAIDLDHKHGVSNRFLATLQNIDAKYKATDKAKSVDQSYGVTQKTNSLLSGLTSYYEKAAGTPTGQKLVNFYTQTSKQVQDIHAEARRLADIKVQEEAVTFQSSDANKTTKKQEAGTTSKGDAEKPTCKCDTSNNCPCEVGQCACRSCSRYDPTFLGDYGKTVCRCTRFKCKCPPTECICGNPRKSDKDLYIEEEPEHCNCLGRASECIFDECVCAPGRCSCAVCPNSAAASASPEAPSPAVDEPVVTTCDCGGDNTKCTCLPTQCQCPVCDRPQPLFAAEEPRLCPCDCGEDMSKCHCATGHCAGCKKCRK